MGAAGVSVSQEPRSTVAGASIRGWAARPWVGGLLLVIATVALYYPVHNHPFINYDDRDYVYENPQVKAGLKPQTVRWAFTTYAAENWHPLTWLSHELDVQVFGLDPAGHHDVNLLLHALDAVLLFWVLQRATGFAGRSFMVAALFALHPINVESVAWVAERKNVLSMMFFLLALGAYRWYVARPRLGRYAVVAALFALGLMAKPQIIAFPFVLLLWDYWPLERIALGCSPFAFRQSDMPGISGEELIAKGQKRSSGEKRFLFLLCEKVPLLILAFVSAIITLHAQHQSRNWYPREYRVGNAILSYGLYIKKAIWPANLALLYPHPGTALNWWSVALAGTFILAITAFVIIQRRHRYLPVGWFWFLGTLVPVLGIVQVGVQAMADRYAYVSFIGLFIMICWGVAEWAQAKPAAKFLLPAVSVVWLLLLAVTARRQIDLWQSDEALWRHALQVTTDNWVAETQLGSALAISGRVDEGIAHFRKALAIYPDDANSNMGMAIYEMRQKNYAAAIHHFQIVANDKSMKPRFLLQVYKGMANCYQALGEPALADEWLAKARAAENP